MAGKTDESKKAEARRLWREEKLTQKQIADRLDAGERTVRRWLADEPRPSRAKADSFPLIRFEGLLALTQGNSEVAGRLYLAAEMARRAGNRWLPQFLTDKVERLQRTLAAGPWAASDVPTPEPWDSLIVGLPLLGEAVGAPALIDIAQAIDQCQPWKGRGQRRAYYQTMRPLLVTMYWEMTQWAAKFGLDLGVSFESRDLDPNEKLNTSWETPRDPKDVLKTLGGKLLDLLSTLPDTDRDKAMLSWRKLNAFDALVSILASMESQPNTERGTANG
ncbi:MAG: hypothetical protein HY532_03550 [Chloroflexi bacterium]|nr:hypothetical protein [Chloroflexota bacterium]